MENDKNTDFTGSKVALLHGDKVILLMRDEKSGIPFPGMLDFPGGGREGNESPMECAIREVREELGIALDEGSIRWQKQYPSTTVNGRVGWFFVASISSSDIDGIVFGGEGQYWVLMSIDQFFSHLKGIPQQKAKLQDFLACVASNEFNTD